MKFDNFQQMYRFSRGEKFHEPEEFVEPAEEPKTEPVEEKPKKKAKKKKDKEE